MALQGVWQVEVAQAMEKLCLPTLTREQAVKTVSLVMTIRMVALEMTSLRRQQQRAMQA